MSELDQRLNQIHHLLDAHHADALWLRQASSFAWATGGKSSYINTASSTGLGSLLITRDRRYVITTNIEEPRLAQEEGLLADGWEFVAPPWYEGGDPVADLTRGLRLAADGAVPGALDWSGPIGWLRSILLPGEAERFSALGALCAEAMNSAIRAVRPGMTEYEISALLAGETEKRGAQAIVNLIATDERIFRYRHPLPTAKRLDRYAMLVLCGRKQGLVCSITRLIHFGPLPDELRRKQEAVAVVDGVYTYMTRPGVTLGEIVAHAQTAYAKTGFADEWRLHHQGGPAGYEPREALGLPGGAEVVALGQAFAWNPSITGTKSEDSLLVGADANTVVTVIDGWPTIPVEIGGVTLARPAILEV